MPGSYRLLFSCFTVLTAGAVGPETCRPCHPAQYQTQSVSHHARALRPILDTQLPTLLGNASIQERNGLVYEYRQAPGGLGVTLRKGAEQLEALLIWAFGSGSQAYTPVGMRNGRYFEHRVSYYTSAARPGRTLGHPGDPSRSLESALGIPQDAETIWRCFNCHATGARPGPDLNGMIPGVSCERCHGPGEAHIAAAQSGRPRAEVARTISSRSNLTARESVLFCADCHRSTAVTGHNDPLSIRFQPVGLMASKCFQKSGTLSCISCHNPHENASRDPQHYVETCLGCHPPAKASRAECGLSEKQNCLPCHMQKRSPVEFLTFTDHRIGINR